LEETRPARKGRIPVQERSQERITKALAATEKLLEEWGPEKTSIPEIAKLANVPRASIYQYFPDKYALFSHLTQLHMARLAQAVFAQQTWSEHAPWRLIVEGVINTTVDYYNANPVASILLLNGMFSREDFQVHLEKDEALGQMLRKRVAQTGELAKLPTSPDVTTLAVEIAFACMKYGYALDGKISDSIRDATIHATTTYLASWE